MYAQPGSGAEQGAPQGERPQEAHAEQANNDDVVDADYKEVKRG
jgi:hypothetical protein